MFISHFNDILIFLDCGEKDCNHLKVKRTDEEGTNKKLLRIFQLDQITDQIALIFSSLVLSEICYQLAKNFTVSTEFLCFYNNFSFEIERKRSGI